jgi:antitoxin MazE
LKNAAFIGPYLYHDGPPVVIGRRPGSYNVITMRTCIVRIGNSRGVRIPKAILARCRPGDPVELEPHPNRLLIGPVRHPRQGWDDAFREVARHRDDALIDRDASAQTSRDETEWEW